MFFGNEIERLYVVNGLARSGNHLFISWLISSFNESEVYYLNNIKLCQYGLVGNMHLQLDKIIRNHIVCNDNRYGKKIDENIRKNLASTNDMVKFLTEKKKIKVLIFSMENNKSNKIDMLSNLFVNKKKSYQCIVIRDILNLFASRIESEKLLKYNSEIYKTDKFTVKWWLDNYESSLENKYVTFNYNKFICDKEQRKELALKLDISYDKTKITLNKYGLTSGSSFKSTVVDVSDYFLRWYKKIDDDLIKYLLQDEHLQKILCKDFSMCLYLDKHQIKVCEKILSLE